VTGTAASFRLPTAPRAVLVLGAGAREHALAWRLARDPGVARVVVAPGNPGMGRDAEVRPGVDLLDVAGVAAMAREVGAGLVVVGPEAPLAGGLADGLRALGLAVFGPDAAAARLESSKSFCRDVATAAGVAMAEGAAFREVAPALAFAADLGGRVVVKADGLAAGKGVTVCEDLEQAEAALRASLEDGRFGAAGRRVVVEERLDGREASLIALCDEGDAIALPAARDHKRLADGDRGPNTGGMGAYAPLPDLDQATAAELVATIQRPVLAELARRGIAFRGALYAGLMLTAAGPRLLEFNVRFGDPEAQALLPILAVPLAPLLLAAAEGRLGEALAAGGLGAAGCLPSAGAAVALVLAAAGYPDAPRGGDRIDGLDAAPAAGALVFTAGVAASPDGALETAGGRVATVVGRGPTVETAAGAAYGAAEHVMFAGRQLRHDIARPPEPPVSGSDEGSIVRAAVGVGSRP
jgi:phosphoribosylamine---glycine ligase